ncbi:ABC transporter permease [Polaribacter aestuariivivens]|uniref:ABC transporter permease n=1 Tax=Polaribacter aestuariivivens TaxID=2304626 RepID=A0A5S3N3N7_9FLAO|nr:ABC transporter permease [Polaribacter aestuariivivens]TMM29941.1 ABC transporter permease [Polaribacter aestuariivivens]
MFHKEQSKSLTFPLYIAKRYLFTKTSNNAINIITIIASFGVIVGSFALFIILSGFSGLRTFSYNMLDVSDPDIKITTVKGKSFLFDDNIQNILINNTSIATTSKVIEERVFLEYNDKSEIAYIKGVDENYNKITQIDSSLSQGTWLQRDFKNTAVIGRGISNKLTLGTLNYGEPLTINVPKPGTGFINPRAPFYKLETQIVGIYSGTEDFEGKFVFVDIHEAKELLKFHENEITAIEIKLNNLNESDNVAEDLQKELGTGYKVQTKEQLNEVFYKVINTENFVSYLIFTLIVIIALFNVIGAIIMMIIDKKQNLKTLFNLGASIKEIKKIFVLQGFLLTFFGMCIGLFLAIILVFLQKKFELFMIVPNLAYPVEFRFTNLLIVFITITVLGFIAAKIASSRISEEFIDKI